MTASALLKVDLDGRVVQGDPSLLNPAGFIIHSAIHMAQTDLVCVMHSAHAREQRHRDAGHGTAAA